MFVHIAHFTLNNHKHWGIVENNLLLKLNQSYTTTAELLADKQAILTMSDEQKAKLEKFKISDVSFLSPVTGNKRVICQGANYRQHMIESGFDPDTKSYNMFFNKSSAAICSAEADIIKPKHVSLLDYEIELGLVIGKNIDEKTLINSENLSEYIGGIVIANDVSARDVQIPETQFFKGKSYRTFCPVGPYLCLLDNENIHYLDLLDLELKVNGETRQKDNTENLVFKPAETLCELSEFSDLDIGDLVLTGTPSGCALRIPSPGMVRLFSLLPEPLRWSLFKKVQGKRSDYLQSGDQIEASISNVDGNINLGSQRNKITSIS